MRKCKRLLMLLPVLLAAIGVSSCNANVGVGMSVGVPVGNHGYMSVGTGRWF